MKNIYIIAIALLGLVSLNSCDEWLEASSSTRIPAEKLLKTRDGYLDALSGAYICLCSPYTYGGYITWSFIDAASFPYIKSSSSVILTFQNHLYDSRYGKGYVKTIWGSMYNALANVNYILEQLETGGRNVIVNETEYNLIKAELLAIRAYVHFDIMRLFGIHDWNGENAAKRTIPYVTKYSSAVTPQLSYEDTAKLLWADINEALDYLKTVDPLMMTPEDEAIFQSQVNSDGFWSNRHFHMNYYAVTALAARVCQWQNNTTKAAEYAREVIDGAFNANLVAWLDIEALSSSISDDTKDWTFSCEHIFSLSVTDLSENTQGVLFDVAGTTGGLSLSNNLVNDILYVRNDPVTGSQAGAEDLRGPAMLLKQNALGYYCNKYYYSSNYHLDYRNRVPMIKIPEMYYILAEDYIAQGDKENALAMLNTVRKNRGISDDLPADTDAGAELMKEYHREFIGEGQLVYWLKHKKVNASISDAFDVDYTKLILPYPDAEINYGRYQEL